MAAKPNGHPPRLSENESFILGIVRRHAGIKRSAVTALTNLTQPSVYRIIDGLLTGGFLTLGETIIEGRGKPSHGLMLNPSATWSIGVSVNTDCTSFCVCDFGCNVVYHEVLEISPENRARTLIALKERVVTAMTHLGIPRAKVAGVGFAMAGFFVPPHGYFSTPAPLLDWSLVNIESEMSALFELPVWTENNATTGAIGEAAVGVGREYPTFGYLSFNYGFGAGIIIEGKPVFGAYGNAGEVSRIFTLDEKVHRPALGELIKRLQIHGIVVENMRDLRERFEPDWPGVREWVDEVSPYLNRAINGMWAIFDPAAVIFGGEVPRQLAEMLMAVPPTAMSWRTGVAATMPVRLHSRVDGDPAVIGAALIPLNALFFG